MLSNRGNPRPWVKEWGQGKNGHKFLYLLWEAELISLPLWLDKPQKRGEVIAWGLVLASRGLACSPFTLSQLCAFHAQPRLTFWMKGDQASERDPCLPSQPSQGHHRPTILNRPTGWCMNVNELNQGQPSPDHHGRVDFWAITHGPCFKPFKFWSDPLCSKSSLIHRVIT